MKLHSPSFERSLRLAVRRELRQTRKGGRRSRLRTGAQRRNWSGGWVARCALSVFLPMLVAGVAGRASQAGGALLVINLWGVALVVILTQGLLARLYASADVPAMLLLPIPESTIFRRQFELYLQHALRCALDFFMGYGMLAIVYHRSLAAWLTLPLFAALSCAVCVALAIHLAAYAPRFPYQAITGLLAIGAVLLMFTHEYIGATLVSVLDGSAPVLNLLLPTGWAASLFGLTHTPRDWTLIILVLPLAGVIWTARHSIDRLRGRYTFVEDTLPEVSDQPPAAAPLESPPLTADEGEPTRLAEAEIEAAILSRTFLAWPLWPRDGWIERVLWAWLTPREKALAEFAFPSGPNLSLAWKKIFRNLLVAFLAVALVGFFHAGAGRGVLGLGVVMTFCQSLATVLTNGRSFQLIGMSGVNMPMFAWHSIGYRELSRLLLKHGLVQLPCFLAYTMLTGMFIAYELRHPVAEGVLIGCKVGGMLISAKLCAMTFGFSSGTNDTARFHWKTILMIAVVVSLGLALIALSCMTIFLPQAGWAWASYAMSVICAYALLRFYGAFYHSNHIDLMAPQRA